MAAEAKNGVQPAADHDGVQADADGSTGQAVMHLIAVFDAAVHRRQPMLVMPEAVGAVALFVHEKMGCRHMGDFRHPGNRDAGHGPDPVSDDQPGIDRFGQGGRNRKVQPGRCDQAQVGRI